MLLRELFLKRVNFKGMIHYNTIKSAFWLCILALVPALITAVCHPNRPQWRPSKISEGMVDSSIVLSWGNKVLWIDPRTLSEYNRSHIPGSFPLNEDNWNDEIHDVLNAWRPGFRTVIYCGGKDCYDYYRMVDRLRSYNLGNIYILKGKWTAWTKTGK